MKLIALSTACASILVMASGAAQAALIDRGGGFIYDTDLNITWLSNASYGAGSSYDTVDGNNDGRMTWQNAMDWAANLSIYDSARGVTYDDWRLPTTLIPDASCQYQVPDASYGHNCIGSEMGHLFYVELGGVGGQSIVTTHNSNYNVFNNIQSGFYWSSTESAPKPSDAWGFGFRTGNQDRNAKSDSFYAWAVRSGDVAAVPVPAAAWLFGSGLLALLGASQARRSY